MKNKITKRTKLIYVENPGSNTFAMQDLGKVVAKAVQEELHKQRRNGGILSPYGGG